MIKVTWGAGVKRREKARREELGQAHVSTGNIMIHFHFVIDRLHYT